MGDSTRDGWRENVRVIGIAAATAAVTSFVTAWITYGVQQSQAVDAEVQIEAAELFSGADGQLELAAIRIGNLGDEPLRDCAVLTWNEGEPPQDWWHQGPEPGTPERAADTGFWGYSQGIATLQSGETVLIEAEPSVYRLDPDEADSSRSAATVAVSCGEGGLHQTGWRFVDVDPDLRERGYPEAD